MKKYLSVFCLLFIVSSFKKAPEKTKPNIIYILADDLGYGELGVYGQQIIETPNLDALAKTGKKYTNHYTAAPVCAPARCMLLTGKHSGHAYVRGNDEWAERGDVWSLKAMNENPKLEGQRPMPSTEVTFAEKLKEVGYTTAITGKWGLGAPYSESTPNTQGFDYFYGYNCQRQAHTLYPTHLWENENIVPLKNKFVDIHQNLAENADPIDPKSYADYNLEDYGPKMIHERALNFIKNQTDKPFFLYYASPLPHVPLQAPQKWIEYYKKKIGPEEPYTKGGYYPNQHPKATYAAMISYLDEQVGDIVALLKEKGMYDNTIIMFSSDNGPSYAGGAEPVYFNSANPFRGELGRGKGFLYEGGIRVPMIASWPNHIKPGTTSEHISVFYDMYNTIADIAQFSDKTNDGLSFYNDLLEKKQLKHDFVYWEFPESGGQQALRMDDWKAVKFNLKKGTSQLELYNLKSDPTEKYNVASKYPDIITKIESILKREHKASSVERFQLLGLGDK